MFQWLKRAGEVELTPYAFIPAIMDITEQKRREIIHRDFQSPREVPMTLSIKLRPWRPLKHDHLRGSVRKRQCSKS